VPADSSNAFAFVSRPRFGYRFDRVANVLAAVPAPANAVFVVYAQRVDRTVTPSAPTAADGVIRWYEWTVADGDLPAGGGERFSAREW
jgi:hypothetical protein